jgi:hypothetical protein
MNESVILLLAWCVFALGSLTTYKWLRRDPQPKDVRNYPKMMLLTSGGFIVAALALLVIPEAAKLWVAIGAFVCMTLFWSRKPA